MKAISIIKYVFTLIGLGLLAGSFFWYSNTSTFLNKAIKSEGVVLDLIQLRSTDSTTYKPLVRFTDQNGTDVEFLSSVASNPPSYTEGEKVEVLYLPTNSQDAKINSFFTLWGGVIILFILGGVFFIIGLFVFIFGSPRANKRKAQYLIKHGIPIETELQSIELNESLSVNGRNPYRVVTQWKNSSTNEVHIFSSNNLWFDPSSYIKDKKIKVYIKANNPKKYFVDLSFLPKLSS